MPRTPLLSRLVDLAAASRRADGLGTDVIEVLGRRDEALASDEGLTRRDAGEAGGGRRSRPHGARADGAAARAGVRRADEGAAARRDRRRGHLRHDRRDDAQGRRLQERHGLRGERPRRRAHLHPLGRRLLRGGPVERMGRRADRHRPRARLRAVQALRLRRDRPRQVEAEGLGRHPLLRRRLLPVGRMVDDWRHGKVDQAIKRDMHALPAYPWAFDDPAWTADGIAIDELSLYDWIETRIPGGHSSRLGQFIDVAYVIEYGEDSRRQGALDLLGLLGFPAKGPWWVYGESDERWKIVGGNQQLSLAQADYLGASNINLGWALTALARNADGSVTATLRRRRAREDRPRRRDRAGAPARRDEAARRRRRLHRGVRERRAQARLDRRARLRREQQAPAPDRRPLLGRQRARGATRTASRTPTPASRSYGTRPAGSRARPGSSSTTPAATPRGRSTRRRRGATRATRTRRRAPTCGTRRSRSSRRSSRSSPA